MVLSAGPDIELVFEVGVPVGEDVPFHIGFRGEPDDGDGTGGAQGLPGQQAITSGSDRLAKFVAAGTEVRAKPVAGRGRKSAAVVSALSV